MLPCGAFDIGAAPRDRIKWFKPLSIYPLSAKEAGLLIKEMAPVFRALHEHRVVSVVAQGVCDLRDAEVAIRCVHCLCGGLGYAVGRAVVVLEIFFNTASAVAGIWVSWLGSLFLAPLLSRC